MTTISQVVNGRPAVPGLMTANVIVIKGVGIGVRCHDLTDAELLALVVGLRTGPVHLSHLSMAQTLAVVPGVTRAAVFAATREHYRNGGNGNANGNGTAPTAPAIAADLIAAAGSFDQAIAVLHALNNNGG